MKLSLLGFEDLLLFEFSRVVRTMFNVFKLEAHAQQIKPGMKRGKYVALKSKLKKKTQPSLTESCNEIL